MYNIASESLDGTDRQFLIGLDGKPVTYTEAEAHYQIECFGLTQVGKPKNFRWIIIPA
jgi:hypothetical protein